MGKNKRIVFFPILTLLLLLGTIPLAYSNTSEEYQMLDLINNERQARGLDPLVMNNTLSSVARLHSQDMIDREFFSHTNPDGLTSSDRARNAGYNFVALGENLCGNPSIATGHSLLMNSPSHSANILNPSFKEVGIGIVDGGPYGKMITQLFGTQSGNITTPAKTPIQENQGRPDIEIKGIELSGQVETLKRTSFDIILTNTGKRNAESFVFAVFEGTSRNGNLLAKANIPHLYVGQEIVVNFEWTPPKEDDYNLYFVADYYNDIDEKSKNNNTAIYSFTAKSLDNEKKTVEDSNQIINEKPDLYISQRDISYEQITYVGTSSPISFKVRNIGNSPALNVPVEVYINGNLKASRIIDKIFPSSYENVYLYLTFLDVGKNNVEIKIDPRNTIREITKNNNYTYFSVDVVNNETSPNPTENKIKDSNGENNISNEKFDIDVRKTEDYPSKNDLIVNKTPEDVNISNLLKLTMKLKDIDASNAYLYYKYDSDPDSFFFIKRMHEENDNNYFIDIDPSDNSKIFYYFEIYTDEGVIRSPCESTNELYSCNINYQENVQEFQILNIFYFIRRFLRFI